MKKMLIFILMTVCCLLLTACYTDHDPWSEAIFSSTPTPAPTATTAPATAVPSTVPPATQTPVPQDAVDVSPNFNG